MTRVVAVLSALPKDIDIELRISEAKKDRTDSQNAALHGVAYKALSDFTGFTVPELHEVCLRGYFGVKEVEIMGEIVKRPRRTTTTDENGDRNKLSTVEFNAFYAFIQQKGSEIGCWVPDPDPLWNVHKQWQAA